MRNIRLEQERREVRFTSAGSMWTGYVLPLKALAFACWPSLWDLVTALCPYGFRPGKGEWQPHFYWHPGAALSLWFLNILPTPLQMVSLLSSQNSHFECALCFCWPWLTHSKAGPRTEPSTQQVLHKVSCCWFGHLQSKEVNTRWMCGLTIDFIIWVLLSLIRWCGFTLVS